MKQYLCVIAKCDRLSNMQHLCVLLGGLFISCVCGSVSSFSVSQSPSTVILHVGEQLQIICSYNVSNNSSIKVKWFKNNQTIGLNQTNKFSEPCINKPCRTLVIKTTDINDEGFYICRVTQDIPQLVTVNGMGTQVTFKNTHAEERITQTDRPVFITSPHVLNPTAENGPIIFAIRCAPFITLLLAFCFLNRDYKQNIRLISGRRSAEEQNLVMEEEKEETEQELEERDKRVGQRGGVRERDEQSGQEGRVELVNELAGKEGGMEEKEEHMGQERRVQEREEQSGQERQVEERDEQLGQERQVEERDEQMGQERQVEERDEQI
ncbi:uncharacterized protein LOC113635036 [Tachysurus fulvidraco]|uniref:uncharacterized protein LOC113635036 n=1 Tax=Tachysurus fulvidraco TaxID=1234273 RepID=UPI001FEECA37|nr:uncharacterized protein LOC113635036 [Tachysurus fulvidraco]